MATNKHATIRYQALDNCFRNPGRRYFIEDLVEACNKALFDQAGIEDGVKMRQVQEDIKAMESIWDIPLERYPDGRRVYYRYDDLHYSINNQPLNETELNQLQQTIYMLNRFKGMPQFDWMEEILARFEDTFKLKGSRAGVVGFEHNPYLRGLGFFTEVFNAIVNRQVLKIIYRKFGSDSSEKVFHPYFLKQYNNRWFLFGLCEQLKERASLTNLALDRIERIESQHIPYIDNDHIDFDDYFDDVIGVTVYAKETERVLLEIDNVLFPYIETKPLHGSQKIKTRDPLTTTIELNLIINYELENLLLGYIDKIRIVAPDHFRERMLARINDAIARNS
ncbi:putative DNA-binding transcriptional regulator YafY [Parabacteroides sp. PFB2-12]|uniref:helix-turn-helix transcriptional regulator n=1 Tax=unclassified Parabacteroides TaxID=2649774 RepID=UPI0024740B04|nr:MULTISPECIES: WYL domain-containing protein [unclassified Parabacteroides]MDH6343801.1 putative DNA-binding transcriptional regulator YafY [Parabacteroides sp. PM6-13]MDH6391963.1 putative DNA-binding transcriptional regulator YafY [Parabacteroides sp. PFB2-12]